MYKDKNLAIKILLVLWQLPQVLLGLIFLLIFRNKTTYTNDRNGITVWNICSGRIFGSACFSTGPIIVTCEGASEETLRHETGHSKQSLIYGPLFHLVVSVPSVIRFWIRRLFNKSHSWYLHGWPEGGCTLGAEELGCTKR